MGYTENGVLPAKALPKVASSVCCSSSFCATPRAITVTRGNENEEALSPSILEVEDSVNCFIRLYMK